MRTPNNKPKNQIANMVRKSNSKHTFFFFKKTSENITQSSKLKQKRKYLA